MSQINVIKGLLADYVKLMADEHPTAAQIVQAYAGAEINALEQSESADASDQAV